MPFYPKNTALQARGMRGAKADAGYATKRLTVAGSKATAANTTGIHAAVTDNGSQQTITTGITQPSTPRNITATAGGTGADIKAVQVTVNGTDYEGKPISETLPAFTVDTPGTVQGVKAFMTVTSIVIPAHDGTGATTAIGFGEKLGLPDRLDTNTVLQAALGGTKEATAPAVTVHASNLASNTVKLNSTLNGSQVDVFYIA